MKTRHAKRLLTRAQVRADFYRRGITMREWAAAKSFNEDVVLDLLRGRTLGMRGNSHNAAVLLGIKEGVVNPNVRPSRRKLNKGAK